MKRLAFALSLVAATAFAAPLAAQGPWYDPSGSGQRTGQSRNGGVYNGGVYQGGVYGNVPTDGRWHNVGKDRQGRTIYVRERYDSNGNLIQEAATRNFIGQYHVIDSRVISYARNNGRYDRNGTYGRNGTYDRNGTYGRDRNDRWDQNNGHDNGKHKGQYKNKNKGRDDDRYDRDRDDDDRGNGRGRRHD